jgi:hypothetical protein
MVGSGGHFPDRREPIALRCPCFAQALGAAGKSIVFFTLRKISTRSGLLRVFLYFMNDV